MNASTCISISKYVCWLSLVTWYMFIFILTHLNCVVNHSGGQTRVPGLVTQWHSITQAAYFSSKNRNRNFYMVCDCESYFLTWASTSVYKPCSLASGVYACNSKTWTLVSNEQQRIAKLEYDLFFDRIVLTSHQKALSVQDIMRYFRCNGPEHVFLQGKFQMVPRKPLFKT